MAIESTGSDTSKPADVPVPNSEAVKEKPLSQDPIKAKPVSAAERLGNILNNLKEGFPLTSLANELADMPTSSSTNPSQNQHAKSVFAQGVRKTPDFIVGPGAKGYDYIDVNFDVPERWYADTLWKNAKKGDVKRKIGPVEVRDIKEALGDDPDTILGIAQVRWSHDKDPNKRRLTMLLETGEEMQFVFRHAANGGRELEKLTFRNNHVSDTAGRAIIDSLERNGHDIDNIRITGNAKFRDEMQGALSIEFIRRNSLLKQSMEKWQNQKGSDNYQEGTVKRDNLKRELADAGTEEAKQEIREQMKVAHYDAARANFDKDLLSQVRNVLKDGNVPRSVVSGILRDYRDALDPSMQSANGQPNFISIAQRLGVAVGEMPELNMFDHNGLKAKAPVPTSKLKVA